MARELNALDTDTRLKLDDVQRVATIMGISADKATNLLIGKPGVNIHIENRSVFMQRLEKLSTEDLPVLAKGGGRRSWTTW